MAIFSSFLYVYQRVFLMYIPTLDDDPMDSFQVGQRTGIYQPEEQAEMASQSATKSDMKIFEMYWLLMVFRVSAIL